MLKLQKNMFHCLPNVMETIKKKRRKNFKMESGHTFLLFFSEPFPKTVQRIKTSLLGPACWLRMANLQQHLPSQNP